jgi:phosphatidylinositol-bisphosphatase
MDTQTQELNVFMATWNAGNMSVPGNVNQLLPTKPPALLALTVQEVNSKAYAAYLMDETAKHEMWMQTVTSSLVQTYPGINYVPLSMQSLGPLLLLVFQSSKVPTFPTVSMAKVPFGTGKVLNNKGAIGTRLEYDGLFDEPFVFTIIAAHLAPFVKGYVARNEQYQVILRRLIFPTTLPEDTSEATTPLLSQKTRFTNVYDSDLVIVMGDLNYRIDPRRLTDSDLLETVRGDRFATALESDQLLLAQKSKIAFHPFQEAPIRFAPTYKYRVGSAELDIKKRMPAWCDRILYCSPTELIRVTPISYTAHFNLDLSDHRPVSAEFNLTALGRPQVNKLKSIVVIDKNWQMKLLISRSISLLIGLILSILLGIWSLLIRMLPFRKAPARQNQ